MDWELVKDVAIPVAAILIPSGIAIWLARRERQAAERDRTAANEFEQRQQITRALDEALDAVSKLTAAAYTDDFRQGAQIRIQAARNLSRAQGILVGDHLPLGNWIAKELGIISKQGLDRTADNGLPVLLEQIVWRTAGIVQAIHDWRMGDKDLQWFADAEQLPLAQTPEYVTDELPE